mgnify:CR=1 FL=1
MNGRITITLLSERQDGQIGDDWKYELGVKVFNGGLVDEGSIKVPEHTLASGTTEVPPGPPEPLVLNAGEVGEKDVLVRVRLDATEVDALVSDHGSSSRDFSIGCPAAGEPPVSQDVTISAGVMEAPAIAGESSVLQLALRLVAESA